MLFNSIEFAVFFPIVTILYFALPEHHRWWILLIASCIFYMAFIPIYILILTFTIIIDYLAGLLIDRSTGGKRRLFLLMSLVANIGVLAIFKYYNFVAENLTQLLHFFGVHSTIPSLALILPIGLSFHTFQAMSYTIEVYRGHHKAERHFGIFALYVMFYPQLVAGPIERPQNLLVQFRQQHKFDYQQVTDGLKLMAWGMFKKVADRLAVTVNLVYADPTQYQGWALLIATFFFALQIYCDFSGYSDIARGAAQVMGYHLMTNFDRPYFSKSIAEFWTRWHISLSTWFRDYLYIPLGGNRVDRRRWYCNLLVTFLISGLWHGASWTFLIWGGLNGLYLIFSIWTREIRAKCVQAMGLHKVPTLHKLLQMAITFALICVSWVFFRARTVADALYILQHFFRGDSTTLAEVGFPSQEGLLALVSIVLLFVVDTIQRRGDFRVILRAKPTWVRWMAYYTLVASLFLLAASTRSKFIYFQF
jgi:D-alanyl-lipoteichoic acid acyltransferase DltB (MBOAT superfamily)